MCVGKTLWRHLLQPLLQQGHLEQGAQHHTQVASEGLQGDCTTSLGSLCYPHSIEVLLMVRGSLLCSCLCHCLLSWHWAILEIAWHSLLYTLICLHLATLIRYPLSLLFSRLSSPNSPLIIIVP